MDYLWVIIAFAIGLVINSFLPSYAKKKGSNLATIEDTETIRKLEEGVRKLTEMELHEHSNKVSFNRDYRFEQYSNLYANLYSIVTQSEFLRYVYTEKTNKALIFKNFDDAPFIETTQSTEKKQMNMFTSELLGVEREEIKDEITSYNKKQLVDYIINNNAYASQKLLKLAVAYRYSWKNYEGNRKIEDSELMNVFNDLEIDLLHALVSLIVKEYNSLRKELNLEYSELELEDGRLSYTEFEYQREINK